MNAQERDQLQQFLVSLRQQRAQAKDPVADALIRDALSSQADAAYLLVQRAMALSLALDEAHQRLNQVHNLLADVKRPNQGGHGASPGAMTEPHRAPVPAPGGAAMTQPSLWMRGLAGQIGGTALGVATGVVAGAALLQGLNVLWGDDAALPPTAQTDPVSDGLSSASSDGDAGLWDLGDDWA